VRRATRAPITSTLLVPACPVPHRPRRHLLARQLSALMVSTASVNITRAPVPGTVASIITCDAMSTKCEPTKVLRTAPVSAGGFTDAELRWTALGNLRAVLPFRNGFANGGRGGQTAADSDRTQDPHQPAFALVMTALGWSVVVPPAGFEPATHGLGRAASPAPRPATSDYSSPSAAPRPS
jgi:hypothetical protein